MEINNFYQSSSSIYMQLAQKKVEQANIEKREFEKTTQDSYDQLNSTNTKYEEQDYPQGLNLDIQSKTQEQDQLNIADAQRSRTANLNKLFLQSQEQNTLEKGVSNEN